MQAAVVSEAGKAPAYGEFRDPMPGDDAVRVRVSATALSHVTRSRASGAHYTSTGDFPSVPGVDGVGRLDDGRRVYFLAPEAPFGSMAEQTLIDPRRTLALPDDLDDATAAAIAISGVSSWAALTLRAKLVAGETVLVNGATGSSGRLGVQIARHLGAGTVIATGRNAAVLETLDADEIVPLTDDVDALEADFTPLFAAGVDIVLDYLWGQSAERLLTAAARGSKEGARLRFVQIGAASGDTINLPSAVLRASAVELMGSGIGSIDMRTMARSIGELFAAAGPAGLRPAVRIVPLSDIAANWSMDDSSARTVFVP